MLVASPIKLYGLAFESLGERRLVDEQLCKSISDKKALSRVCAEVKRFVDISLNIFVLITYCCRIESLRSMLFC